MADVTISSLPLGTPAGNNVIPYSTGTVTLGVPVSAMFQNAGNIGIGTAAPEVKLHVVGEICTPGRMGIGTLSPVRQLTVDSVTNPEIGLYTSGTERVKLSTGGSAISQLVIDTAGQPRVVINSTGMGIGIGTAAPATKLEVAGEYRLSPPAVAPTPYTSDNRQGVESANVLGYTLASNGTIAFRPAVGWPFYVKKFFKMNASATGAVNHTLCEIDVRNIAFSEFWVKIVWGTRIQAVSDTITNMCERAYGYNKFASSQYSITNSWSHVDAGSDAHMDINLVSTTPGVALVQLQQSSIVTGSSFVWGYMEICSVDEIGTTNVPVKFNC